MSAVLQWLLVALAVAVSAIYSAWRLMPATTRVRALNALAQMPLFMRVPALARWRARRLERATLACGGCAGGATGAASPTRTPGALRR